MTHFPRTLTQYGSTILCSLIDKFKHVVSLAAYILRTMRHFFFFFFKGGNTFVRENARSLNWDLPPCHHQVLSPSRVREPLLFLSPPSSLLLSPLLQSKLEDLSHHPRFSSNLVGSKVASWAWAGSRWLHAQGDQAKALQVLTPPLPWVPGWGGSGSGNLPELSGMTSRLPLHHPLLCSHMAPATGALSWGSDLRKINCARAGEGKPHSLGMSAPEWILSLTNQERTLSSGNCRFVFDIKSKYCGPIYTWN